MSPGLALTCPIGQAKPLDSSSGPRHTSRVGLFDLRCGVSGLPTGWRPTGGRVGISMFLLEPVLASDPDAPVAWQPWTPPVRGCYDRYGGIELWPADITPETNFIGERLESLLQRGALVSSWPEDLASASPRAGRTAVERILGHGAETVYNRVKLTIDGAPVAACIVLERVVDAIAGAPRAVQDADAWFAPGGAGKRHFADLPVSARAQLARHAAVLAYARARGGLTPIRSEDLGQPSAAEIRGMVRATWDREDGPLRRMIDRVAPRWTVPWRRAANEIAADDAHASAVAGAATIHSYSPSADYVVGDVLEHPSFGRGRVEALPDPGKISVRFAAGARTMVHRRPR